MVAGVVGNYIMFRSVLASILIFVASMFAANPIQANESNVVDVTLSNFSFAPKRIELKAERSYTLQLRNTASGGHSFAAPDFFAAAQVEASDNILIKKGIIEVPRGSTVAIRLKTGAAGTYKLKCTHFLHGEMGMKGRIVVK